MPRVRLYLRSASGSPHFQFIRADGTADAIPALRLFAYADMASRVQLGSRLAAKAAHPDCVIDTGSHLSTISESVWGRFKSGVVTPLAFDPAMPQHRRFVTVGGGRHPYDLGELTIRIRDLSGNVMDLRVIAQLTRDGGTLTIPLILGLRGGVLDGRILHAEPDPTAPFGQTWFLEDP